ncbi:MAG: guanylate kinase [Chloroflexota bacterium]|nr:guanylate kinase [Dehalococcoidia bacterium]MDW8047901.1 guanylate kinase [Chloroflexota bacterium]
MTRKPVVIVLHGPSGVGKDTVIARLRERLGIRRATSSTTRPPRPGEVDGIDYHFLDRDTFLRKVEAGEFLEFAEVYGDLKGLERRELEEPLARGEDVIIRTDVQGARWWRQALEGAVFVLLVPEDIDALRRRLEGRNSEDPASLAKRLAEFDEEVADAPNNDYVVVNREGALDETVDELAAIIERERANPARPAPRIRWEVIETARIPRSSPGR